MLLHENMTAPPRRAQGSLGAATLNYGYPSDQNTVTMIHLVLDDLGGPAGEGFDPLPELLVVPADLDLLIALTLPGAAQQAQAALLGLIFPLCL